MTSQKPESQEQLHTVTEEAPVVALRRIRRIHTYEVMDTDLVNLEHAIEGETQSLAFWTFLMGIAIPTGISWWTTKDLTTRAEVLYAVFTTVPAILSVWFLATWIRNKRKRPSILAQIRQSPPEATTVTPPASPPALPPKPGL